MAGPRQREQSDIIFYAAKSDKKDKFTKVASVTGTSKTIKKIGGKTLEKGAYYSFMIIAVDNNDKVISSSVIIYVATEGGKVSNYSAVKTGVKGNKVSLKKGAKFKLKATSVIKNKKLKVKKHSGFRYVSTNKKIATVSKKGNAIYTYMPRMAYTSG